MHIRLRKIIKMRLQIPFLILLMNAKNLTLEDEIPKVMWAPMGKLVPQFPGVVTFSSDLHFRRVISCWKGI